MNPYSSWPNFSQAEADAVSRVLLSNRVNYWTGEEGRMFEREFAEWAGVDHAVAVTNGTVALDLCWRAIGLQPGDEVVVTPRTFLASVSSIVNAGGVPVFADVCRESQNITPETVAAVMTDRTKAICLVHLAGWPCDMDGFRELISGRDIALVEDCAQAHGATYKGKPVGGLGDIAAWSFCQDKIMSTGGEGGMVTTSNSDYWKKAWSFKDHGKSWEAVYEREHPSGFRWLHDSFGTNWRLTEMQSVIGRLQLRRMGDWHEARVKNADILRKTCAQYPIFRIPDAPNNIEHANYKFYVFVDQNQLAAGWNRDSIMNAISEQGVPCFSGSCSEVYLEKSFVGTGFAPKERLPVAKELGETSLMFLVHPTLSPDEIEAFCEVIHRVATDASQAVLERSVIG